jgi:hypothetical protein
MSEDAPFLLPQHQALIEESGISPEVALARGYRSITGKQELLDLGFSRAQCRVPALLLPVWTVHGEIGTYQLRPDAPRQRQGKDLKYETPAGSTMVVDVPPSVRDRLGDPAVPLLITEGVRKADAAASRGLCCIALLGVWNWRGTNAAGGTTVLADFEAIAFNGREVYLAFDSDVTTKPAVTGALRRLAGFLASHKAVVRTILLPAGDSDAKVGLDDYLAAGHSVDDLLALATEDAPLAGDPASQRAGIYAVVNGCFAYVKHTYLVEEWCPICNFTAQIVEDITLDDGIETHRVAVIRGRLATGAPLPEVRIPFDQFEAMTWVSRCWGATAILNAGQGNRDKVREAIQRFSGTVVQRREYAHAGWRQVGDAWVFLGNGSAIGAHGIVPGITVRLDGPGEHLVLHTSPGDPPLPEAMRHGLEFLELAPDPIAVPLLGAAFRAVLNEIAYADVSVFLVGPSGVFKSELASLVQSCFGSDFTRLTLPATWAATANYLERVASDFKDCVLVIDDFAPGGTTQDVNRYHAVADRVIRGAGNASGRGRMNANSSLHATYRPRALIVGTGEDVPRGHSIRARMLVLELARGDVDTGRLATFQDDRSRRSLVVMLSGFIQWLAPRLDGLRARLPASIRAYRASFSRPGAHARSPEALAHLATGWSLWLDCAVDAGAINASQRAITWQRVWTALQAVAGSQTMHQAQEHPVTRFLELLRACLAAGDAHVAGPDGRPPDAPEAWGWRERIIGSGEHARREWEPLGRGIGWLDASGLYLEPNAAYHTVKRMGDASGATIPVAPQTLWKRMDEAGLLQSTEMETRGTRAVRKVFAKARRATMHLAADVLDDREPAERASSPGTTITPDPPDGQGSRPGGRTIPRVPDHQNAPKIPWLQAVGQLGQDGQGSPGEDGWGEGRCTRCGSSLPSDDHVVCEACSERWTA